LSIFNISKEVFNEVDTRGGNHDGMKQGFSSLIFQAYIFCRDLFWLFENAVKIQRGKNLGFIS